MAHDPPQRHPQRVRDDTGRERQPEEAGAVEVELAVGGDPVEAARRGQALTSGRRWRATAADVWNWMLAGGPTGRRRTAMVTAARPLSATLRALRLSRWVLTNSASSAHW